ncbi:TRAP transporter substrate-binding protein [Alkalilimnicola sp. S0819]|uniref:TRAP transporter substrate-binding protein n=1 Tax=Alkalilimnicola sp. S0819 TaxID=2613922 RepID=UPI00126293F4|nr:TRAP transporter substrate-binding protein DctP [Alkalilimnicola sp. S0819]KAB7624192.1 twin-arginine translocation signal domain-containing protein [Alkalilimnicola sp. S0819]MPQ16447.1 twin-arginine translocation signal domain-containing protein [Alkalilimnicola sp. S0819]
MKRRDFIKGAGAGAVAGAATFAAPYATADSPRLRWRMTTSWPAALVTLFGGAEDFCERLSLLTGGRFTVRAYPAGELAGGLQVLDAVQDGSVQMGHTASYYYAGKEKTLAIDTALPFGMTARMQNAWMYHGGGQDLLNQEVFSNFGVVSFPGGNTNTQMGGWFRKEVNGLDDLKGLKMRIPGFGGEVMSQLGVNVQTLAAGEIYSALERGVIDATEFVGPADDIRLGFHEVAKNYYAPSWWEPSAMFSIYVNKKEYDKLPPEYKEAIRIACTDSNVRMIAQYDHMNPIAVKELLAKGVKLRRFSEEIMAAAEKIAFEMYEDLASENKTWAAVYRPWKKFRDSQYAWFNANEQVYQDYALRQVDLSKIGDI